MNAVERAGTIKSPERRAFSLLLRLWWKVTLRNAWRVRVAGEVPPDGLVELLQLLALLEGGSRC